MKITREADYALRIVALLAAESTHLEAKAIAERSNVPYRFTLKILRKIVQAGYLKSQRGANGGYYLAAEPENITMKDIIEVIDGRIGINICLSGESCPNKAVCRVRGKLSAIQQKLMDDLAAVSFADIIE